MHLGIPQIIILLLYGINIGATGIQHGEPKTGKENFWATLISTAINAAILWWGGFWE